MQIVNWRTHLKFPEEAKLSPEAKDLTSRLLCNVDQRLGTKGANEIKVLCSVLDTLVMLMIECIIYTNSYSIIVISGSPMV